MTLAAIQKSTSKTLSLASEWNRIELLGLCLQDARVGKVISEERLAELREQQQEVMDVRLLSNSWAGLHVDGLTMLEMDILACVLVTEAQPRLAWMYQSLQPSVNQPYATVALIQSLLALNENDVTMLRHTLLPNSPLRLRKLIDIEGSGPFQLVKPGKGVMARLFAIPDQEAPPGAVLVEQDATWDDLVLAEDRKRIIQEFLMWVRHERTVVGQWGGQPVGGPVALFAGRSGTGKTYAAMAVAHELGWPLYQVDLGKLVSKYIGETEKNLNKLFDAAHGQQMVLQFDEVDSIMGKRGDLKEARDRYANMEVSHLLARIEQHRGPCILTTNLRDQLDQAFYRRFQAVVEFPQPDEAARAALWKKLLPQAAPIHSDVDPAFLAAALSLTGGNIRNAALHAAYLAAEAGQSISLEHLATAVWREITKSGKAVELADLGPLAEHVSEKLYEAATGQPRKRIR
ncbi:MAG: ATP-binding protein [Akkermansiaceae bacterium]